MYLSFRKSSFLISNDEAVKEFVLITAPGVIAIPLGLMSITLPFELSLPAIEDGVDPFTLLREKELLEG